MPVGVVRGKRDERLWSEAKAQAAKEGHAQEWDYVMRVFQRMKLRVGGGKMPHIRSHKV